MSSLMVKVYYHAWENHHTVGNLEVGLMLYWTVRYDVIRLGLVTFNFNS